MMKKEAQKWAVRDNPFVPHHLYIASDYGALLLDITLSEKSDIRVIHWFKNRIRQK